MKELIMRGALSAMMAATVTAFTFGSIAPAYAQAASAPTHDPGMVMLGDYIQACKGEKVKVGKNKYETDYSGCAAPRAAAPGNMGYDTPLVPYDDFVKRWPNSGNTGYQKILKANCEMCDYAREMVGDLNTLDGLFGQVTISLDDLKAIYNGLPAEVRRATRIAQVSQVGQTIASCLLSAGLYCIGVAIGAIGNGVNMEANLSLQLANIKLSLLNIATTRLNVFATRVNLRAQGLWWVLAIPACKQLGIGTLSGLPELGPAPDITQDLADIKKN